MAQLSIKLSDVGEGVAEAELIEWHVAIGDWVEEDQLLGVVMTDKAAVEIPSSHQGRVVSLGAQVGDVVPVGEELICLESATTANTDSAQPTASPQTNTTLAAPAVRMHARKAGLDLNRITGTGPDGRVTHQDVDAALKGVNIETSPTATTTDTDTTVIKVVGLRRRIAEKMTLAYTRIPHITIVEEVDVTKLEDKREKLNTNHGNIRPKLTVLPFMIKAIVKAVNMYPMINAHFDDDTNEVTQHRSVHIGIATQTPNGLVVPVLKHCETMTVWQSAEEIMRLAEACREGRANRDELTGSTITITSLGPLGALATTPIINHPEVAIVGINRIAIRPMWDGQIFQPRKMMNISCSFDHRVIDGWDAAVYVQQLKSLLESPDSLEGE